MKKTKSAFFIKVSFYLLIIGVMGVTLGCDQQEMTFDEDAQNKGVVQTEWRSDDDGDVGGMEKKGSVSGLSTSGSLSLEKRGRQSIQGKYVVQIGAFLFRNNAERLVKKMKSKGYDASMFITGEKVKQWHIVRIGAFENKTDAIAAAGDFTARENTESAVLLNGKVIKMLKTNGRPSPQVVHRAPSVHRAPARKGFYGVDRYTFQVGGLLTYAIAKKQKDLLKKRGYAPFIVKVADSSNKETWYTVRIGKYYSIDEAADAAAKFAAKEDLPTKALQLKPQRVVK